MSFLFTFSMFFLSFSPLWLSAILRNCKSIFIDKSNHITTEIMFITTVSIIWIVSCIVLYLYIHNKSSGSINNYEIMKAKECKTITSDFLLSYILPLFAFDFNQWNGVIEFLVFFVVLAFLCIKHNHLSVNIILELMNFKMYECSLQNCDKKIIERIVISKETLTIKNGNEIRAKSINNEFIQMI